MKDDTIIPRYILPTVNGKTDFDGRLTSLEYAGYNNL